MNYSIAEVNNIVQGKLLNITDAQAARLFVSGIDFDSRQIQAGDLFLPIADHDNVSVHNLFADYTIAEKDGHNFIQAAMQKGAVASLADHEIATELPLILVSDTQLALWRLAQDYLQGINPKTIAVTGSNGKTTTKDLIASLLSMKFQVHKTHASYNNEIGVPMTILKMPAATQVLVIEMGMDRPGQLTALSKLVNEDIAVITMIGEAHIAFFKTRAKIADAKMEITAGLKENGVFIYNGDEPLLRERSHAINSRKLTFGEQEGNSFQVTDIQEDARLIFKVNQRRHAVQLLGKFNADNCAAAIAVAKEFSFSDELIQKGFDHLELTADRLQQLVGSKGETIISDVYNSNPTAALKALDILKDFPANGKKILVLGDMLELGKREVDLHLLLKDSLEHDAFDRVYLVGTVMKHLADQIEAQWYPSDSLNELIIDLQSYLSENDVVLLKASHGIHLEKVERALI
ncbi:UDP-N-acetylmuramoyl-tripeptide--D-alanyl-D-alanine ligase [Oenococcus sicerae]|uniref:UDP-N-acetylmuramoyl-tripeptide--D-alanyl-D-alanine ligase n=1 Tax=Oenococcus sicerae TaxID=2203724 RepID=A0AAJ1RA07_9LACO|nr:UDP-N-acetylmuramoyl-tripeptide--D-alanyl-D-alanine ligase [Oenococcus sicerae]MDN6900497.1 UDP-N-acetylmuramoyl-tripeptide--D-alanyl-D-alanine ligase [Oenococcus sicerae]